MNMYSCGHCQKKYTRKQDVKRHSMMQHPGEPYSVTNPPQILLHAQCVPKVSQVPQVLEVPQVPLLPQVLQVPQVSQVSQLPQIPQVPQMQHVSQVPHMPQVPQLLQVPQMPQMPQVPQVPQMLQVLQVPHVMQVPEDLNPPVVLQHPFTMIVAAPTGSGKSTWVKELLVRRNTMIKPPPQKIMWFYRRWQPLYTEMKRLIHTMEFIQGIPPNIKRDDYFDTRYPTLFVIDDLMKDATQSTDVCELFTEGSHHRNLSVVCLLQNLYYKGKEARTMSLNAHYMVLFKNPRDQQQVTVLARQMYPGNSRYFMEEYHMATQKPYGYLFIDLKQNTPESQRLKHHIFQSEGGYKKTNSGACHHLPANYQQGNISQPLENIGSTEIQTLPVPGPQLEFTEPAAAETSAMATYKDNQVSCLDCGLVYATPIGLQQHVKRGCPEAADSEDDSPPTKLLALEEDSEDELDDDNNDPAFETFINNASRKTGIFIHFMRHIIIFEF